MENNRRAYLVLTIACLMTVVMIWLTAGSGSLLAPYAEALALLGAVFFAAQLYQADRRSDENRPARPSR